MSLALDDIPSVKTLLAKKRAKLIRNRELEFLGRSHDVQGVKIRSMSAVDFAILSGTDSPFLSRSNPTVTQLFFFLWVLSKRHLWWRTRGGWLPSWVQALDSWLFTRRAKARVRDVEAAAVKCIGYVEEMLEDAPAGFSTKSESFASSQSSWCHSMRSTYGSCTESEVLNMPLPKLFQYIRNAKAQADPNAPESNQQLDEVANRIMADIRDKVYTLEDLQDERVSPVFFN